VYIAKANPVEVTDMHYGREIERKDTPVPAKHLKRPWVRLVLGTEIFPKTWSKYIEISITGCPLEWKKLIMNLFKRSYIYR